MGTSYWEEAPVQTQNSLEGQYVLSGLGTLWDPQEELESVAGERDVLVSLLNLLPPPPEIR